MSGTWMVSVVSAVLFLVAAKAHGRELRLEREAHGIELASFRSASPAVQALWSAERARFWSFFVPLAIGLVALSFRLDLGHVNGALSALAWAGAGAYLASGVWAIGRRAVLGGASAWEGSLGWWMAVGTMTAVVTVVAAKVRS
jgi:hypothetical protein